MSARAPSPKAHIDRLALTLSGVTEADGRTLALLVAERLAAAGVGMAGIAPLDSIRIRLTPRSDLPLSRLSEQIAAAIVRQLGGTR